VTDRRLGLFLLLAICLAAIGLGLALAWNSHQSSIASPVATIVSTATPGATIVNAPTASPSANPAVSGQCHSLRGLPDPACTPGVADPRVTQANIHSTICVSGYTATVRPPSSYTDSLKRQQIQAYGYSDTRLADYEEDHLIPLELGGSPTDPKNLWPEPRSGAFSASKKDALENSLRAQVCAGSLTLASARAAIATNWESA
jgi:hypothetical protein